MKKGSKQFQKEENKTISITEVRKLRFKVLKPNKGEIEIVNHADNGRVCKLLISDFRSVSDANVYAELLKLAPELLNEYMNDTKKLEQVVARLGKKVARTKENMNAKK
ncbi:MAG: hypothetical protein ABIS12_18020 [Bacteroidia bacterium]